MKPGIRKFTAMICVAVVAIATSVPYAEARKIRTRHSIPKGIAESGDQESAGSTSTISLESDSIALRDSIAPGIRFYGFDKTAGSGMESFFITNGLKETLIGLEVEITYTDMKGRQLHKRTVKVECEIPPGETMRTDVKSWDIQKSFYFHQSAKPKRQATPFDVRLNLLSAAFLLAGHDLEDELVGGLH